MGAFPDEIETRPPIGSIRFFATAEDGDRHRRNSSENSIESIGFPRS